MRAMQQWLDRFCYKHPRLSIPGLMRYIVIGNVLVFLLDLFSTGGYPIATSLLSFSSDAILQGQIWRIITFVFVPATSRNIFLFAITLYFYYFIGNALEREWGSNKFTIFYFFGILLNILVGFLVGTASMYYVRSGSGGAGLHHAGKILCSLLPLPRGRRAGGDGRDRIYRLQCGKRRLRLHPLRRAHRPGQGRQ